MMIRTTYKKPMAEPLYLEPASLICDSLVGGDLEDLIDGGTEEW